MKKIPYGISNFKKMIENNYIYIDKTQYIELLENYNERYIFFLRPRRFGKSLFISLLSYYYDINSKDDFELLFKDLYIGKKPTSLATNYYILHFNFSKMDTSTKEILQDDFTKNIIDTLADFITKYHLDFELTTSGTPARIFSSFLKEVRHNIDGKIFILIDEYDHFANELLSFQVDTFEETISKTGFVRKWYEALKEGTEIGIIDRIFATGVSPVTLDSLTSGFNIASDLTRTRKLNEMMGFTEDEVRYLLNEILGEDIDKDLLIPELKRYYNGYKFSGKVDDKVFNSDMILYYLNKYQQENELPLELIDTNISSDYSKMRDLFTLKNKKRNLKILEDILKGNSQTVQITREFSLAKEFTSEDFLSLLFYMGFLTIDKSILTRYKLKVPNYVIKELYFDFFAKLIRDDSNYDLNISGIKDAMEQIALKGEINDFINIIEKTLEKLSNRDFIKYDEKYIKLIFLSYLMLSNIYYVKSEYEVEGGYIDIALLARSGVEPEYEGIIELKYIKQSDYEHAGDSIVNRKVAEAKEAILRYKESEELREKEKLKKWVIVFAGSKCVECLEVC